MSESKEYNPLDYENLTRNCVEELMKRGPYTLPLKEEFRGCGVYALFYTGNSKLYTPIKSRDAMIPIYVGKAVPTGARKGGVISAHSQSKNLFNRIHQHTNSIKSVPSLNVDDFLCRYLVVSTLWITMAERFLIEHYRPAWNVCIEGFGNHDPGKGRHAGVISLWDCLHPGRKWAASLNQGRGAEDAEKLLSAFFRKQKSENA